jgi:hypothetical protein
MFLAEHIIMPFRNLCREEEDLVCWSSKFKSKIARLREKLPFSLRVPHSFTEVKGLEILHASITKAKAQLARLKPGQRRFPLPMVDQQSTMATSTAFDKCESRPPHIDAILNGLDRYNPETTTVFQDYVSQQCEDKTFDCYANLALLKL